MYPGRKTPQERGGWRAEAGRFVEETMKPLNKAVQELNPARNTYLNRIGRLRQIAVSQLRENQINTIIINALLSVNEKLRQKAYNDDLTGIFSRRGFTELLKAYAEGGVKNGVFISLDIDKFKSINDTYDHIIGDRVLQHVAAFFSQNFRVSDPMTRIERKDGTTASREVSTAARRGGEEFVIFLPGENLQSARLALERMGARSGSDKQGKYLSLEIDFNFNNKTKENNRLAEFGVPKKRANKITFSGSIMPITISDNIGDWEKYIDEIIQKGEPYLKLAKDAGRNRVYVVND